MDINKVIDDKIRLIYCDRCKVAFNVDNELHYYKGKCYCSMGCFDEGFSSKEQHLEITLIRLLTGIMGKSVGECGWYGGILQDAKEEALKIINKPICSSDIDITDKQFMDYWGNLDNRAKQAIGQEYKDDTNDNLLVNKDDFKEWVISNYRNEILKGVC